MCWWNPEFFQLHKHNITFKTKNLQIQVVRLCYFGGTFETISGGYRWKMGAWDLNKCLFSIHHSNEIVALTRLNTFLLQMTLPMLGIWKLINVYCIKNCNLFRDSFLCIQKKILDLENTIMNFHENVRVMYNSFFKLIEEQQFELTSLNNINKYFWLKMGAQDLNKCFILIHRDHR